MKKIKIYPALKELLTEDKIEEMNKIANDLGLLNIDNDRYNLIKLAAQNKHPEYPDNYKVVNHVRAHIAGNGEFVTLYCENKDEWFRTSPIVAVREEGKDYLVVTQNSLYKLERQGQ